MKNLKGAYNREANKFKPKCNPLPGFSDSCNKCNDCNKKRRFPVEEEGPTVCCGIIDPVPHFNNQNNFDTSETEPFVFNMNCPVQLKIKYEALDPLGTTGGIMLDAYVNNQLVLTYDQAYGDIQEEFITINPNDSIYFSLYNANLDDSSIHISMFNETCQIDYGLVIDLYKVKYRH